MSGAAVTLGGRGYSTDASGRVVLGDAAAPGTPIDAIAAGFLDRQTLVREEPDIRFTLWPTHGGGRLTPELTQALVYTPSGCPYTAGARGVPLRRLRRSATRVTLVPGAELVNDAEIRRVHETAIAVMNRIAGGAMRYTFDPPAGDAVRLDLVLLPDHAACETPTLAVTNVGFGPGGDIFSATIAYCTVRDARNLATVTHELGHTFGLNHSPDRDDLMYCTSASRAVAPSPREELLMSLLMQRRSGNVFPDNDRTVTASAGPGSATFVCQ